MATTPLAYNIGSAIAGTTQVGDLAVGTTDQDYSINPGGVSWWMGPEESDGYVIAVPVSGNTQPTPVPDDLLFLSPTYKGADVVLYNNNQTAAQIFGYQQSVLGINAIGTTDKVMFSVLCTLAEPGVVADSHFVGVGYTTMNFSGNPYGGFPGNDNQSMGYGSAGDIWYNGGVYQGGLETWGNNDIIDIVVDNNTNGLWVRVNGGNWNNNPSANPVTGSNAIETIGGPFYPVLCPGYEGTMIIQNTSSYGIPSGYNFLGNLTASVGFYKSTDLTDNSFIELTNDIFGQSFTGATEASSWLTTNGYWNSYGNLASFTINPSDFTEGGPIYQDTFGVGTNGVDGFVNTGAQTQLGEGYYGSGLIPSAVSTISAAVTAAGLDPNNSTGYIWSVTWGSGSTISTGYVKFGYYGPSGYFDIQTIDPADTDWQLPGNSNGTSLAGTFLFPATFTQYVPSINKGGWC
jgi:hypothetical protein